MRQAKSHHTPTPSRRAVIKGGGKAALAVGAAVAGAAAAMPSSPDAELLAAFKRWLALEGSLTAAFARSVSDAEFDAACDAASDVARQIATLPATSTVGLAAKVFLTTHVRYGGIYGNPLKIDISPSADGELVALTQRSLLADAAAWLPAIREMVA